jgi:predicted enzyme related to lactoylglutathione lyase
MAHGEIAHVELPSDDVERAKAFYEGLFGWTIRGPQENPNYQMFTSGPGDMGGTIGLRGQTAPPDGPRLYVTVDSIDTVLAKLDELGGSVVVGKTAVSSMGWYAAIRDSEGNELGIWEAAPA